MSFKQVPGDIERVAQLARETCVYRESAGTVNSELSTESIYASNDPRFGQSEQVESDGVATVGESRFAAVLGRAISAASVSAAYFFAAIQLTLLATLAIVGGLVGRLFRLSRRLRR